MTDDPYDGRVEAARDRMIDAVKDEEIKRYLLQEALANIERAKEDRERAVKQYITLTEPDEDKPF